MNEVIALLKQQLEDLKQQEATMRKENAKLQDRTQDNSEKLLLISKKVAEFEQAVRQLED